MADETLRSPSKMLEGCMMVNLKAQLRRMYYGRVERTDDRIEGRKGSSCDIMSRFP